MRPTTLHANAAALALSFTAAGVLTAGCAGKAERRGAQPAGQTPTIAAAAFADPPAADHPSGSVADPSFLEQYAQTYRFRAGAPTSITPTPDGDAVLFLRSGPRDNVRNLYSFDPATGQERVLLTAAQLLDGGEEELSEQEKARRERMRLSARGVATFSLSKDGAQVLVPLSGSLYVVERAGGGVRELPSDAGFPIDARLSPDASRIGVVRDGDFYVIDLQTGGETRLTHRESEHISYAAAEFVAQEEMSRFHGYWWSPDSQRVLVQRTDTEGLEVMHLGDPAALYNEPNTWPYPRAGQKNAGVTLLLLRADGSGDPIPVEWDHERYPYLATVKWPEGAPPTLVVQNRQQTEQAILAVDTETGGTRVLFVERDDAWVDLDQGMPHWLEDGSGFLWTTERNGGWQIELRSREGGLRRTITTPDLNYRSFIHLDEEAGAVYFTANADNPTQTHVYAAPLDTAAGRPRRITRDAGLHGATFSRDGSLRVFTASTLDGESRYSVQSRDGRALGELVSVAEKPFFPINVELTTVHDGVNEFHCAIIRPRGFDATRRYPVINHVYAGPTSQMVTANRMRYALGQWIADHGFVVISIDNRGTPGRGSRWQKQMKGNMIDLLLEDQANATLALAAAHPEMDASRVGVFGWSYGGYFSAMAVMRRPDVFHAGFAGAPVTDWEDYDTHYTERYLDTPQRNPEGYAASNVLTYAHLLERPLLIAHGTVDDNVHFTHALKMSDALFRAGREHEFLPLSGFTHMVADPLVTTRLYERIMGFFLTRLTAAQGEQGSPPEGMPLENLTHPRGD